MVSLREKMREKILEMPLDSSLDDVVIKAEEVEKNLTRFRELSGHSSVKVAKSN